MGIGINGRDPNRYVLVEFGEFNEEVFVNVYTLSTRDSFEYGEAYSIHLDRTSAERFVPNSWWRKSRGPFSAYVRRSTLERIKKMNEERIFSSWEN